MRNTLICVLFVSSVVVAQTSSSFPNLAYDSVDPFIGTGADGNTFPGATLPFGMIQWSPDTRPDGWYHYSDKTIRGFNLTHISGADVRFTPTYRFCRGLFMRVARGRW